MANTSGSVRTPKTKPANTEAIASRLAAALDVGQIGQQLPVDIPPERPQELPLSVSEAKAPLLEAKKADAPIALGPDLDGMYRLVKDGMTRVGKTMETVQDAARDTTKLVIGSRAIVTERTIGIHRTLLEMMEINFTTGLKTMQAMARAGNVTEAVRIQSGYCQDTFKTLASQAETLRNLSTDLANEVREPFRAQVTASVERMKSALRPH